MSTHNMILWSKKKNIHFFVEKSALSIAMTFSLETPKKDNWETADTNQMEQNVVWSGSTQFALTTGISIKHRKNKKTDILLFEIDWSKELW